MSLDHSNDCYNKSGANGKIAFQTLRPNDENEIFFLSRVNQASYYCSHY